MIVYWTPDKLGETIAKANENLVETLASHGLLRTQTPKISQFSGDELKGDVSFEHWEYEIETLRKAYTESAIKEVIIKSLKRLCSRVPKIIRAFSYCRTNPSIHEREIWDSSLL